MKFQINGNKNKLMRYGFIIKQFKKLKRRPMNTLKKFELMEKIVRELEDLQNSQQALIQKIGKIEVDNIELGDSRLEKDAGDMHQRLADNLDTIVSILDYFANKTENFGNKNNVEALKEQEAINNATS